MSFSLNFSLKLDEIAADPITNAMRKKKTEHNKVDSFLPRNVE